jgi:hypothetical protein
MSNRNPTVSFRLNQDTRDLIERIAEKMSERVGFAVSQAVVVRLAVQAYDACLPVTLAKLDLSPRKSEQDEKKKKPRRRAA